VEERNKKQSRPFKKEEDFKKPRRKDLPSREETACPEDIIAGRNPCMEALRSGMQIEQIFYASGEKSGSLPAILEKARKLNIPAKEVHPAKLKALCGNDNHQGIVLQRSYASEMTLEELLSAVPKDQGLLVLCDSIEDPHNLGAIIRSAEAAGAQGVICPRRRSAPVGAVCYKASAGACAHLPLVRVPNLVQAAEQLKQAGFWLYAAEAGGQPATETPMADRSVALVIGSEGQGVSRLMTQTCDGIISLPMLGKVNSLNASVAGGILLYEVVRQRMEAQKANAARNLD